MLIELLRNIALYLNLPEIWHNPFLLSGSLLSCLLFIIVCFYLVRAYLRPLLASILNKLDGKLDEETAKERLALAGHLSHLVPAILLLSLNAFFFEDWPQLISAVNLIIWLYLYIFAGLTVAAVINLLSKVYAVVAKPPTLPYQGIAQLLKLVTLIVVIILVSSLLLNKSPVLILSGFGALTAVLMLIFKDTILGFVAGIQMAANNMVTLGDWIEMPKYGADGDVIEIGLTTVKVSNWDKTITTIPTYALISDSFKNWRGMQQSGGRRIKRAIKIDIMSIHFVTPEELAVLKTHKPLQAFLAQEQLQSYLESEHLTNIGLFRHYMEWVLKNHPQINQNMLVIVRQLQPTEVGLPLEIYCFSADKRWVFYEKIQADIFDQLFAIMPFFNIMAFQRIGQKQEHLLEEAIG